MALAVDSTVIESHVRLEQLRRLCQQLPTNLFANLFVTFAFTLVYHADVNYGLLLTWVVYAQAVNLYGTYIAYRCRREQALEQQVDRYLSSFERYTLADAIAMAASVWIFFSTENAFLNLFFAAILLGVVSGGQNSLISHLRSAIPFTVTIMSSLVLRLLVEGRFEYLVLAVSALVYMAVLLRFAIYFNQNLRQTWRLSKELESELAERKKAETCLRESEERYRRLVEQSPVAIVVEVGGKVAYTNDAALKLWGAAEEQEILGLELSQTLVPEGPGAAETSDRTHYECRLQRLDGSRTDVEVVAKQIRLYGQEAMQWVIRDISARKKVDKMKDDLISTVSHELRTPLTSIYGAVGIMRGVYGAQLDPKLTALADIIYNNSLTLTSIVNDILDISKMEAGELDIHCSEQPVVPLLEQVVRDNTTYASQFKTTIELECALDVVTLNTDPVRFKQILNNLLSNAIKHSHEQGRVRVQASNDDKSITVSVQDYGAGIPAAFQGEVFSKFAHIEDHHRKVIKGTGLGLYLTKSIVQRLGGEVWFTSAEGVGSTFSFSLPL